MKNILFCVAILCSYSTFAQNTLAPNGGGAYEPPKSVCITDAQRAIIEQELQANREMLVQQGILSATPHNKATLPMLNWPVRQANGFNYFNVDAISNFVDLDANYPNQLQDYNCGTRTYDLNSGYNHGGIDIFLWPFDINMMDNNQAEIVAAADGVILAKYDGQPDKNCAMNNFQWNAVYVQHADGSVAWYGHMKTGSLTTKIVGATVTAGEYLGVVGSSGSSTGPHLHFELRDAATNVVDPNNGPCNTAPSLWNTQRPYRDGKINALMTHSEPPVFWACPNPHVINAKDTFERDSSIVFAAYYRDQENGQTTTYTILRPDNTIEDTWTHSPSNGPYNASWWYWTRTIPAASPAGKYTFRASYNGTDYDHEFYILGPVGIYDVAAVKLFTVHPNPARNFLSIEGRSKAAKAELYNIVGQLVMIEANPAGRIDISNLQSGMYVLKLFADGYVQQEKILITK